MQPSPFEHILGNITVGRTNSSLQTEIRFRDTFESTIITNVKTL